MIAKLRTMPRFDLLILVLGLVVGFLAIPTINKTFQVSGPSRKSPPLADVYFPSQIVDYPIDWPAELRYPDQFKPVAMNSGALPEGGAQGWGAKLIYEGTPEQASANLSVFFTKQGWQIVDRRTVASGLQLFIQRDSMSQTQIGIILFGPDPDKTSATRVLATLFF